MEKFLVTGEMRSGTTFMANFLNSQEGITCYADFLRSPFLFANQLGIDDFKKILTSQEKNILYSSFKANCDTFNFPIYRKFDQENFHSVEDFLTAAFSALAESSGKSLRAVGIKMTKYPEILFKLLDLDYKIIYLLRDPRDVVLSSKNRFMNFNIVEVISRWKKAVEYVEKFKDHPNFAFISYEKFIAREDCTINLLEEKLGVKLNFDLQSLNMRNQVDYVDNSSFSDVTKLFDSTALNRWKKSRADEDVILTNFVLKKQLEKYKYETMNCSVSNGVQLQFHKKQLKYSLKNFLLNYFKKFV